MRDRRPSGLGLSAPDGHLGLPEQLAEVAKRLDVTHSWEQDPHLRVGEDGAGDVAAAEEVLDLRDVVVGQQQLHAVAAGGGEQVRQPRVAEDVARLVEGQQQPRRDRTPGARGTLLGLVDDATRSAR